MKKFLPKKPEKEVISVRIDSQLLKTIDIEAAKIDISRNELINQCIEYALDNIGGEPKSEYKIKSSDNFRTL